MLVLIQKKLNFIVLWYISFRLTVYVYEHTEQLHQLHRGFVYKNIPKFIYNFEKS